MTLKEMGNVKHIEFNSEEERKKYIDCGADGVDYKRCYFRKECTGEADVEDWLKAVRKE